MNFLSILVALQGQSHVADTKNDVWAIRRKEKVREDAAERKRSLRDGRRSDIVDSTDLKRLYGFKSLSPSYYLWTSLIPSGISLTRSSFHESTKVRLHLVSPSEFVVEEKIQFFSFFPFRPHSTDPQHVFAHIRKLMFPIKKQPETKPVSRKIFFSWWSNHFFGVLTVFVVPCVEKGRLSENFKCYLISLIFSPRIEKITLSPNPNPFDQTNILSFLKFFLDTSHHFSLVLLWSRCHVTSLSKVVSSHIFVQRPIDPHVSTFSFPNSQLKSAKSRYFPFLNVSFSIGNTLNKSNSTAIRLP